MYYILYLASLCRRRHWPEPTYEAYTTLNGHTCIVRVNNREYVTDTVCPSEPQARENAAMRAYLICRNFSVNDGMYPAGLDHGGVVQGIPVAIGTGRKTSRDYDTDTSVSSSSSSSSSNGVGTIDSWGGGSRLGGCGGGRGRGHGRYHSDGSDAGRNGFGSVGSARVLASSRYEI